VRTEMAPTTTTATHHATATRILDMCFNIAWLQAMLGARERTWLC
jgi:hypothetical protein